MVCELSIDHSSSIDDSTFHGIAGRTPGMREIFQQILDVAPTGSNVLVLGETGTGKELVANALHALSPRRTGPFVKLNCSAMQPSLLESELFGHERGAFTGACARRTGRFAMASQGTMFLDEVGELPLAMQPKLLRVLEEKEFELVGSSQTIRADVRLVAATHRQLDGMCAQGAFREDLFYRLNVFPICLPPLRRRRDDIPTLVHHLLPRIARRLGKDVRSVSDDSMRALQAHDWPGNVRELQNVLERSAILSRGPVIHTHPRSVDSRVASDDRSSTTLEEVSRSHILSVLASTNGVIAGRNGAAARLGMKRSTLHFRMKKLGIDSAALRVSNNQKGISMISPFYSMNLPERST